MNESKRESGHKRENGRVKKWCVGLSALLLWACIVIALWAYRKHSELSEKTRLLFSISLGEAILSEATILLDGRAVQSGDRMAVGWRELVVSHPKAESFSTNFFARYGDNDLGNINLTRTKGTLVIAAKPPISRLTIQGPEFSATYTNLTETNLVLPADRYLLEARYRNWERKGYVDIAAKGYESVHFKPPYGVVEISASHPGASFELASRDRRIEEIGNLPRDLREIPEGEYTLLVRRKEREERRVLSVKEGATNEIFIEFPYGAAFVKTEPPGATVEMEGQALGQTPLLLSELATGTNVLTLHLEGYQSASIGVQILGKETNRLEVTLVDRSYAEALQAARRHLQLNQFASALETTRAALRISPQDPIALELERTSSGLDNLRLARLFLSQGNYAEALSKVQSALKNLPENQEARELLERVKQGERRAAQASEAEWMNRGETLFKSTTRKYDGGELFQTLRMKSTRPVQEVEAALLSALRTGEPIYRILRHDSPIKEGFLIEAEYEMPLLSVFSGKRNVIIVGARNREGETETITTVIEYKPQFVRPEGSAANAWSVMSFVPIHTSRLGTVPKRLQNQVNAGISDIRARIEQVVAKP
jgi:tetratricopeptide (TPR) repeat protein